MSSSGLTDFLLETMFVATPSRSHMKLLSYWFNAEQGRRDIVLRKRDDPGHSSSLSQTPTDSMMVFSTCKSTGTEVIATTSVSISTTMPQGRFTQPKRYQPWTLCIHDYSLRGTIQPYHSLPKSLSAVFNRYVFQCCRREAAVPSNAPEQTVY